MSQTRECLRAHEIWAVPEKTTTLQGGRCKNLAGLVIHALRETKVGVST
jgi:hypothetical protein